MTQYYYADEHVVIYHGDGVAMLGAFSCDCTITDPPYGTGKYATDVGALTADVLRALPQPMAVFGYPEHLVQLCMAAHLVPSEWIVWWPTNGAIRGFNLNGARRESEHIAIFGGHTVAEVRVPRTSVTSRQMIADGYWPSGDTVGIDSPGDIESRRVSDVWTDSAPGLAFNYAQRLHPNEKPVEVMKRLVQCIPGDMIYDPFMGSGTTLVAAKALGRKAIGVEIDEQYCEVAARRLSQGAFDFGSVRHE